MIGKTIYLYEKLKNKLRCGEMFFYVLVFSLEKNSLGGKNEFFSTDDKEGWRTSAYKN